MAHGTFLDAASWFWPLDDQPKDYLPLPIRLLREGYDVWVTNMRGSTYSTGHSRLDSSKHIEEYWSFSQIDKGFDQKPTIELIKRV